MKSTKSHINLSLVFEMFFLPQGKKRGGNKPFWGILGELGKPSMSQI
jgi:hypothetical protein